MNKIILLGNLTKDPIVSETKDGKIVCNFDIAVNEGTGENRITDYFRIKAWGKLAEVCGKSLSRGAKVLVIGKMKPNIYQKSDGTQGFSADVFANEVEFLSPKRAEREIDIKKMEEVPKPVLREMFEQGELPF